MIQVLQKGYRLGDHVLRPARVVVSSGAPGSRRGAGVGGSSVAESLYETLASPRTPPPTT